MDPRLAEGRGRPVWTVDDREARISPLDLQVSTVDFNFSYFQLKVFIKRQIWLFVIYVPAYIV